MKNIKILFLIVMGVFLLDSCIVVQSRNGMGFYRRNLFLYSKNRAYKKLPNYHPQPKKYYNPIPQIKK